MHINAKYAYMYILIHQIYIKCILLIHNTGIRANNIVCLLYIYICGSKGERKLFSNEYISPMNICHIIHMIIYGLQFCASKTSAPSIY